jgi:hypothetical protein
MPLDLSTMNPQQLQFLMALMRGGGQQPGGLMQPMGGGMGMPGLPQMSPQQALMQQRMQNPGQGGLQQVLQQLAQVQQMQQLQQQQGQQGNALLGQMNPQLGAMLRMLYGQQQGQPQNVGGQTPPNYQGAS